ncbi:MAG TPA: hypothetical protein PLV66_15510 [Thermoanaerobaculales bacterium]|nr:hypothetical protein [Thermoanaerobaculales bacterium]
MFGMEDEPALLAQQVEVAVGPGVEITGAAQGLAWLVCRGLADVVDQDDGDRVATLQLAEPVEQEGDVASGVLVGVMETDQGIEDEQSRLEPVEGGGQALLVLGVVEPEAGLGDQTEREPLEVVDPSDLGDAGGSVLDGFRRVFGCIHQDVPLLTDGEASEAREAGSDSDSQLEGEPGFAALGRAADEADGLVCPEVVDKPGGAVVRRLDVGDPGDGEGFHGGLLFVLRAPPLTVSARSN